MLVNRIETLKLISAVKLMFEWHPELLSGFNIFLPRGYSIDSAAPKKDPILLENLAPVSDLLDKVKVQSKNRNKRSMFTFYSPNLSQCFTICRTGCRMTSNSVSSLMFSTDLHMHVNWTLSNRCLPLKILFSLLIYNRWIIFKYGSWHALVFWFLLFYLV